MLLKIGTNFVYGELKKVKTNLAMFLIFFWVIWFSQLIAISTMILSLPDITEIPTITVTEVPLELLEPTRANIDALVIDAAKETITREHENHTLEMLENDSETIRKDEKIIKFDDSGGGELLRADTNAVVLEIPENIPNVNISNTIPASSTQEQKNASSDSEHKAADDSGGGTVNLTAEEVPIPVFSEWAQKQMEAAEKQQAMEQEVVNTSAQKKNNTNGSGKAPPLKMRNKNYASPDCGAKIIASNSDASNTGAVLSSSKDEYMLSPCGNRIWFVVELCEAIQAQKVELANFELFSSSPKNFTVAVSNRFPTRDWSNVGRFIAEDKRNVQSFDLHPHLFGKFVRVDIHSHYSKEHFCPVSLFRVFGTSEFEAFETENQPHMDIDDFDDEFAQEQAHAKNNEPNLFKSASDAVLSIVKKAAEVLVKPANSLNTTLATHTQALMCRTPAIGQFSCADCNRSLVERINNALSCEFHQLQALLQVQWLRRDLLKTRVCAKQYGIETKGFSEEDCSNQLLEHPFEMDVKQSYYLNMLPVEYVGALCQLLASQHALKSHNSIPESGESAEPALNLTIDKKLKKDDFEIIDDRENRLVTAESGYTATENAESYSGDGETTTTTTERNAAEDDQLPRPPQAESEPTDTSTLTPLANKELAPDVNIFNVPAVDQQQRQQQQQQRELNEAYEGSTDTYFDGSAEYTSTTTMAPPTITITTTAAPMTTEPMAQGNGLPAAKGEEDPASWEGFDHLLTSTTASPGNSAPSDGAAINTAGVNLQVKIPNGPQSESVFIRLSNRIKALERNMSLSGQYLEELSRRYKKQVEELQLTLTQQMQTVRLLEEQNRRHSELQQLLAQRNTQLKEELDDMSLQVHACIVVIIFVGAFVFLVLMVSILFYRAMRRETKDLLALYTNVNKKKSSNAVAAMQKKLNRRKSFEDFSDHPQSSEKIRRPSEEALMILKDRDVGHTSLAIETVGDTAQASKAAAQRERKISICYNNNGNGLTGRSGASVLNGAAKPNSAGKRRGEKHSWPNTEHTQQQARQHLAQLQAANDECILEPDHQLNSKSAEMFVRQRNTQLTNCSSTASASAETGKSGKSRKKSHNFRRQESAPNNYSTAGNLNSSVSSEINAEYDESLRLEEDDLDNFIPTSDLAYNEFMPDGPSGYQVDDDCPVSGGKKHGGSSKAENKKLGRLGAPGFFKSPFSKSLKLRTKSKHPHESTSWEWYRSKNTDTQQTSRQQQKQLSASASASAGFLRTSPAQSLDSSSLSEVNFPNSCTENSFRILEEAILSSGESITKSASTASTAPAASAGSVNGNGHTNSNSNCNSNNSNSGSSAASNSNHSSISSTSTKKKNRGFNKIFRKVF